MEPFASIIQELSPMEILPLIHEEFAVGLGHKAIRNKDLIETTNTVLGLNLNKKINRTHILYVIDPFDIISYCFPFGFDFQKKLEGADLDRRSDRQTAWDYFFNSLPQIILMDEHRAELGRLRNRLIKEIKLKVEEFEEFEKLVKQIYSYNDNSKIDLKSLEDEIFHKRLPWLVAAATGELHNGPARFRNILNKLIVNNDQTTDKIVAPWLNSSVKQEHVDIIQNIFRDTPAGQNAFKQYQNKLDILSDHSVDVDDKRRENLLVDYKVTDRIIKINQKFKELENDLQCRYIVLYMSSDRKAQTISQEIFLRCPNLLGKPLNLMRNVSQTWLHYLVSDRVNLNSDDKDNLESYDKLIQNLIIVHNTIKNRQKLPKGEISDRISNLRKRLEWHGLIKNISNYSTDLKQVFEDLKNKSTFEPLKQAFSRLIETVDNTTGKEGLQNFEREIRNFNIQVTVLQRIVSILNRNLSPAISSVGYVVGINHHLPTLFEKVNPSSKYQFLIEKTVIIILTLNKEENFGYNLSSLANELKTMLLSDDTPDLQRDLDEDYEVEIQHFERQTLLHLFALILPSKNLPDVNEYSNAIESNYNLDSELDELLMYDINTIRKRINKLNKLSLEEFEDKYKILLGNLYYIRIWALRRNNKLDECVNLLDKLQKTYKSQITEFDARFIHGKALISYSLLIKLIEDEHIDINNYFFANDVLKKYWKRAQRDTQFALNAFVLHRTDRFDLLPFEKVYSALLNTHVYLYVIGYAMNREAHRLLLARQILDQRLKEFDDDRKTNPEYLHTEAYLEYFEALHYISSDQNKSRDKILLASEKINLCINLNNELFPTKIDPDYFNLKNEILKFAFDRLNLTLKWE